MTGKMAGKPGKATKSTSATKKASSKRVAPKAANRPSRLKDKLAAATSEVGAASTLIDRRIEGLGDWRGKTLQRVREIIKEADSEIVEEWKWETPVWSHNGIVCTGEAYKNVVKLTFARGASLPDPSGLFNSSLEGKVRRAIDIREGDRLDEAALKELVRAAGALNLQRRGPRAATKPLLLADR